MPHDQTISFNGTITHVFGHRFVVQGKDETILADVTPKGLAEIKLAVGDSVALTGERKPTELKVSTFSRNGKTVVISHGPKDGHKHDDHAPADPAAALRSVKDAGYTTLAAPRRKPKHFEVLAQRQGELVELHVELGGHIRKSKSADRHDPKWALTA